MRTAGGRSALVVMALLGALALAAPAAAYPASPASASGHGAAAHVAGHDTSYAALAAFARQVGIAPAAAATTADRSDDAHAALADFARTLGSDEAGFKLAQAQPGAKPAPAKSTAKSTAKPAAKPVAKAETKGGEGDAYFVGSAKCATCHAASVAEFATTQMGRIGKTTRKGAFECENCHGPASKHVAAGGGRGVGGMVNFAPDAKPEEIEEANGVCLTCHERGNRTAWKGSTHETRGLACSSCHTVMRNVTPKAQLASAVEAEVCFQCHKLQRAQMQRSSHMPVREGKMTCSNCHNPHGSVYGTEASIREPSINDNCYKCHAEKRGPLLHEHPPVRENCLNCHDAHGSNHEYLLKVQRPRLCAECHGFAHGGQPGFNALNNYAFGHGCNNCHSQVHGSNHPGGQWFQR